MEFHAKLVQRPLGEKPKRSASVYWSAETIDEAHEGFDKLYARIKRTGGDCLWQVETEGISHLDLYSAAFQFTLGIPMMPNIEGTTVWVLAKPLKGHRPPTLDDILNRSSR